MYKICFMLAMLLLLVSSLAIAALDEKAWRATTDVRADRKTGRLVRSVVIQSAVVAPKVIPSRPVPVKDSLRNLSNNASIDEIVAHAARKHDIDPVLVHAVIQVESNYNPSAVSEKGAQGLMQLVPSTARLLGVRNSFDRRENIEAGVRYLRYLKDRFSDDWLMLAAYNAGEDNVARHRGIPPYPETHNYIYLIAKKLREMRQQEKRRIPAGTGIATVAQQYRPVEYFVDAEGRLHMRTR